MAQSKKKTETVKFVSPWATARFPKLDKPDTDGKFADGKYKTDVILEEGDLEAVRTKMLEAAAKLLPGVPVTELNMPLKEFFRTNKETKEKTSDGWGFRCKSKNVPFIWDSKKNKLPKGSVIGGGSEIRIAGALAAWTKPVKMKVKNADGSTTTEESEEKGLTVYLNEVQVRKLVESNYGTGSDFDEVEGFEYEAAAGNDTAFDDQDATSL